MNIRNEMWLSHQIRFVEINRDDWWAVAKDIADALDYRDTFNMTKRIKADYLMSFILEGMNMKSTLLSEFGIYKAIFNSHKPEAEAFQEWVFDILKILRQSSGLAGFEVFRMLDKEEQRKQMARLCEGLSNPSKISYIKANGIANKAVSTMYGYPKKINKGAMSPKMLVDREMILDDTVNLMTAKERFGLDVSVSKAIYKKYGDGS